MIAPRLRAAAARLGDLLVPPACVACGRPVAAPHGLCADCWPGLWPIDEPACPKTGRPLAHDLAEVELETIPALLADPPWTELRAAVLFNDVSRTIVHDLKFHDRPWAGRFMAHHLRRRCAEWLDEEALLTPVPLHRARLWRRRFNQSATLARLMAKGRRARLAPEVLVRSRATRPQTELGRRERLRNVTGAFAVAEAWRPSLAGRAVILIDDVLTTGATASACAEALLEAGAASVRVAVFALAAGEAALHI